MPDFPALRDAALSVREVLRTAITLSDEAALTGIEVDVRSPRELELAGETGVISLWTHRLEVQPDLLNRPPQRPTPELELHRSVPVDLLMHVTVLMDEGPAALLVMGRVLQAIFDHRRLSDPALVGVLAATGTELFVEIDAMTAYDTSLIWSSLHTHHRLGIGVRVRGVFVDSDLPPISQSRVLVRHAVIDEIQAVS